MGPRIVTHTVCLFIFRALLAGIKFLGKYPCPCCLIMKSEIHKMGMKNHLHYCVRHICVDTSESQTFLEMARRHVFKGFKVDGSKVGGIKGMDSESHTPTYVSQIS